MSETPVPAHAREIFHSLTTRVEGTRNPRLEKTRTPDGERKKAALAGMEAAFDFYDARLKSPGPITEEDIKRMQRAIGRPMQVLEGGQKDYRLGRYRVFDAKIGNEPLLPPPAEEVCQLMQSLVGEYQRRSRDTSIDGVYRTAAWLHLMFEAIHPFNDFNGRTGRLIADLHLEQAGLRPVAAWLVDVAANSDGKEAKEKAIGLYFSVLRQSLNLRANRWNEDVNWVEIPGFDDYDDATADVPLSLIGDDYLLPLEIYIRQQSLNNHKVFVGLLEHGKVRPDELAAQQAHAANLGASLNRRRRQYEKLTLVDRQAGGVLLSTCPPREYAKQNPGDPSGHVDFINLCDPKVE